LGRVCVRGVLSAEHISIANFFTFISWQFLSTQETGKIINFQDGGEFIPFCRINLFESSIDGIRTFCAPLTGNYHSLKIDDFWTGPHY
jgi:hypothetical protein